MLKHTLFQRDTVVTGVAGVRLACMFQSVPYFEMCVTSDTFFKPQVVTVPHLFHMYDGFNNTRLQTGVF